MGFDHGKKVLTVMVTFWISCYGVFLLGMLRSDVMMIKDLDDLLFVLLVHFPFFRWTCGVCITHILPSELDFTKRSWHSSRYL